MNNITCANRTFAVCCAFVLIGTIYFLHSQVFKDKSPKAASVRFISVGENIGIVEGLAKSVQSDKYGFSVIAFFNRICMTCPSGMIIRKLKEMHRSYEGLRILALLSNDFSENDKENIKANLGIEFQLKKADEASGYLLDVWDRWKIESQEKRFSNGAFLIDMNSKVIRVLQPSKEDKFLQFIQDRIDKKR